jgi:hypothetical protein
MDSGAVIYVPSFIKFGSGIQMLIGGDTQTHTRTQQRDLISLLIFLKRRKVGSTWLYYWRSFISSTSICSEKRIPSHVGCIQSYINGLHLGYVAKPMDYISVV